jgi:type II secretory pathway pseudopilin PulG
MTSLMPRVTPERGISLVEATVILMVLAVLTSVLAPSAADYVNDARQVKAAKDVQAIGSAIEQVLRDITLPCLSLSGASCALDNDGRAELLVSGPNSNQNLPAAAVGPYVAPNANTTSSTDLNWGGGSGDVNNSRRDEMDNQLVVNEPDGSAASAYPGPTFMSGGGYRPGTGWRGPYMGGSIGLDPWNYAYQVNTVFLAVASDAAAGTGEGQLDQQRDGGVGRRGRHHRDAIRGVGYRSRRRRRRVRRARRHPVSSAPLSHRLQIVWGHR